MPGRLDGKVALITGTAGGQGRAAALLFAREGARVVGCDLNVQGAQETVEMVRAAGGEMLSLQPMDVADGEQVKRWIDLAVEDYGGFDILYNNAAANALAAVEDMTWEQWHFTIRNELDCIYWTCHYAFPHLKARGGGSIISTASAAGMVGVPWLGTFAHAAGKGGVLALTRQLAVEGGPFNVRANSISPGPIDTAARAKAYQDLKELERRLTHTVLNRIGRPEEIASVALFLASDDSSYVTGANIVADGGQTAW